jgi:chemotaxis family two-component system sensor histidine kinase/response regulator PixL
MIDRQIQERAYGYFLAEAPDLLHTIEQEILTLPTEHTTPKVHNLMRALHTLKGAAASVDLELIKNLAHDLEDIVRVFYNLEVEISLEIQSWLLAGYSALNSALDARMLALQIDEEAIYAGFQHTIEQLKDRLGDRLAIEVELPSSIELGFDFVTSIFETDVREQIDRIKAALASADLDLLSTTLNLTAEICTGLAESAELDGFLSISQAIGSAISQHPDRVEEIADLAIANLELATTNVLGGDRTHGGEILPELAMLSKVGDLDTLELDPVPPPVVSPRSNWEPQLLESEAPDTEELDTLSSPLVAPPIDRESEFSGSEDLDDGELDGISPLLVTYLADREGELVRFRSFLTSDRFRSRQPLTVATQDFLLDIIRLCWDWFEQCVDTRPSQLDLDLLIAAEGLPDLDYINHWIGLLLARLREEDDSPSLEAYRRSCLDQVVFAVAKYLAEIDPQARIRPEFLDQLRSQLQTAVTRSKQQPSITATEKAWLDRLTLPHNWNRVSTKRAQTTITPSDDELLQQIWGQPQLVDRSHPIPDPETRLVAVSTLKDLGDLYRDQLMHAQQLQSLLAKLYQHDPDPNPQSRSAEDFKARLSVATQAVEQIQDLIDRQQQLLDDLDPVSGERAEVFEN